MLWLGVVAIVAVAAAAPARPQLSADFQAQISLLYVTGAQELLGTGHWLIDSTKNMGVQSSILHAEPYSDEVYLFQLERYDLGHTYTIKSTNLSDCNITSVTGDMPNQWAWVENATYVDTIDYDSMTLDVWQATFSGFDAVVAVNSAQTSEPVLYNVSSAYSSVAITFHSFLPTTNFESTAFDVPDKCSTSASFSISHERS
eukprot:m.54786 g.54786  ORF g.54786 m.54786 type:complete len:201 (+) comp48805_c0_seq2:3-605(+)